MKYLRFGEIPKGGRSVNYLKLTYETNEDFTYDLRIGDIEGAFEKIPKDAYEVGLSVFEIDQNRMPILSNLQLVSSLLSRLDDGIYEVSGVKVGDGNDGEPLISLSEIEKKRRIGKEKLVDHVLSTLLANFKTAEYDRQDDCGDNKLFSFYVQKKINKKTGEKVSIWDDTDGEEWVNMPAYTEYKFNGWTFSHPVDGFDVNMGIKR